MRHEGTGFRGRNLANNISFFGGAGGKQNRPWILGTLIYEGVKLDRGGRIVSTGPYIHTYIHTHTHTHTYVHTYIHTPLYLITTPNAHFLD